MLERNSALTGQRIHGRFGIEGEEAGVIFKEIREFSFLEIVLWEEKNASLRSKLAELLSIRELPVSGTSMTLKEGRLLHLPGDCFVYLGTSGVADILEIAVTSEEGSVVSLSHAFCYLHLGGTKTANLLRRGIRLDLRDHAFPVGRVSETEIGGIDVLLHRPDAQHYDLLIPRSHAQELWRWLTKRAAQFGYAVL